MTQNKKRWKTPELLVLARTQPAEALLQGCKMYPGMETTGPSNTNFGCYIKPSTRCYVCEGIYDS